MEQLFLPEYLYLLYWLVLVEGQPSAVGCTDPSACNYDADANVDDGSCCSCDVPAAHCGPGTHWDATLSACVSNIPSAEVAENCTLMSLQELTEGYLNLLDIVAHQDSLLAIYQDGGNPSNGVGTTDNWTCGDPLPYQGYDYATVQIGDQCWFAENLRNTAYSTGDPIPGELNGTEWQTAQGAQSTYEELSLSEVLTGRLYNLHAVIDPRNLCPAGWHVPSLAEFNDLLDPAEVAELKSTSGWTGEENSGTSGFNALPGGRRDFWGNWYDAGNLGVWWTSTPEADGHALLAPRGWTILCFFPAQHPPERLLRPLRERLTS